MSRYGTSGEDWYRSRIVAGHDDWGHIRIGETLRRLPKLEDEGALPLCVLAREEDPDVDLFERAWFGILRARFRAALELLPYREAHILHARYGLDDGVEQTMEEIGLELGLTRERVRQIQNIALDRLCAVLDVPAMSKRRR